jgi:tRNA pseudouridine(55) synthase
MEEKMIIIYKEKGQTPLECIQKLKEAHVEWKHVPLTYAGRLDPLARGILLILIGEECVKKDEYLALPKEYEIVVLLGISTDTYDILGKVTGIEKNILLDDISTIEKLLPRFTGGIIQKYPPYSSRTVSGKPLFQWAREGKLEEITIPSHEVFVESITLISMDTISSDELHKKIISDIAKVSGDFRQEEILHLWNETLEDERGTVFQTVKLKIKCSSGTYVRSIADDLGKALKIPSLALDIVRTKIGNYISSTSVDDRRQM